MEKSERAQREEKILQFWQDSKIFQKSLEKKAPKGDFVFYEGPPTANGKPAIHHLEARAFKDAIPRYKTMQGFHVSRKAGWDTHGLPVELEVEKTLGLKSKKEIEKYGIAEFNKACKESVQKYIGDWTKFTDRIGYWVNLNDAYFTYDNSYIEAVWSILAHVEKRKLLYKDYKVLPWCPRCGTALSSHELAQGYKDVKDLSVYVKFKLTDFPNAYFLAWTTTPWTLPGNVALAVGNDIDYVEAKVGEEIYVCAKERLSVITEPYEIVAEHKGKEMVGMGYEPLYPFLNGKSDKSFKVYAADFVNTVDGTGIVHTAVMYGQDDFVLGTEIGLPKYHLVNEDGSFKEETNFLKGKFVMEEATAVDIIKDLAHRHLLYKKEKYEHSYPHCWRCKTRLIYYARDSWYIKMSELRDKLVKENEKINWEPEHIREGRFGEWLREVKDWAISRERYWGTPLPIWQNSDSTKRIVVDSIATLKKYSKTEIGELDLHRPYIDEIVLEKDGEEYRRVKEVLDVWFDSGAVPFAQDPKNIEYPADFISEAIDQTRGWFYTLHAIGVLMEKGNAYKNVICLGHLLDKDGKKMSKSIGNVVDPWEEMEKHGVDALRFWMYSVNQPGESKNFDTQTVAEIVRKVFNILDNVYTFYNLYRDKSVEESGNEAKTNNILDLWILSKLNELIETSTTKLDQYKLLEPARAIKDFLDDLSTWFLRRSRERIKDGDKEAKSTLYFVLKELSKIMAPLTPFMAEDLYQGLKNESDPASIHLENWPKAGKVDTEILEKMDETRKIVSMALEARSKTNIKVRQPLQKLYARIGNLDDGYIELIKDEINVKEVENKDIDGVEFDTNLTPELIEEGKLRDVIRLVQDMRKEKGLKPDDHMDFVPTSDEEFFATHKAEIEKATKTTIKI